MTTVFPGRWTAESEQDVTVFLIGMRVNRPWRVDRWWPIFSAMPPMIRTLAQHPELGLLSYDLWFGRTTLMLSYWRSPEHLQRFAADRDQPHLEPWRRYMRTVGSGGGVGIWHETYVTTAGSREVVYANMPRFGLAEAIDHAPIGAGTSTARQRMGR